jgi:DNA-binding CsgD family transcriptional regulator/PAS domain-containing protein
VLSGDGLSSLLDSLYRAAGEPRHWDSFLSKLANLTGASAAAVLLHDKSNRNHNVNLSTGVNPEALRLYDQHYGFKDEWFLRARIHARPGWTSPSEAFCPSSELEKTEFYNDFLRRYDFYHQCGTVIEHDGARIAHLSILRGRRRGVFADSEVAVLRTLFPHVRRALQLHRHIVDLKLLSDSYAWVLDQVPYGIVLLDSGQHVLLVNKTARQLAAARDGLIIKSHGLEAGISSENRILQSLLRSAGRADAREAAGGNVLISRRDSTSLVLSVYPVRECGVFPVSPKIAVFITDPSERCRLSAEATLSLFGLTPAEVRLALLLSEGKSLKDAADWLGVATSTVRTQLKSIFRKTNTSRQSELTKFLCSLPPVVDVKR